MDTLSKESAVHSERQVSSSLFKRRQELRLMLWKGLAALYNFIQPL